MTYDLGTDLDQLLPECRQRPVLDCLRQGQCTQEVAEIVSERMQLKPNLVVAQAMAGKPRPVDRMLAFLDMLLGRASSIVELRHALGWSRQVGDDEADARVQLAGMSRDLGHDTSGLIPGRSLVAEAGMKDPDMFRRSPDGTRQQVGDAFLQDRVGRETDSV